MLGYFQKTQRQTFLDALLPPVALALAGLTAAHAAEDIVLADFEGADYGAWTADGTAFGGGPARGTLPGQMKVEVFLGKGLVNSFNGASGQAFNF